VRQNGSSIAIPKPVVIIDSAEHMGYNFCRFSNWFEGSIRKRLPTGDYSLVGFEEEITIERKTLSDLVSSVITCRSAFIDKCERMSKFRKSCIVVEASLAEVKSEYECSQAQPNAVLGSIIAAQERWDIPVYFLDDFILAEEFVASMLSKYHAYSWLETNGYDRCLIEGDI
jgi:ERCC4-type nuclease